LISAVRIINIDIFIWHCLQCFDTVGWATGRDLISKKSRASRVDVEVVMILILDNPPWRQRADEINQSLSLIATLRPESRIANDMQLK